MRKIQSLSAILVLSISGFIQIVHAQNVSIPDAAYKAYLVGEAAINTNSDSEIQLSEAIAYTGEIVCPSLGINDLTGTEEFINITGLKVGGNNLTSIDISKNVDLLDFECHANQLTTLDLSKNLSLTRVVCRNNTITSLDVRPLVNLEQLYCQINDITYLDLSQCGNLTTLWCNDNDLRCLDISNGNNTNMTDINVNLVNNINLTCIQVDDVTYSSTNWTNKDVAASYSTSCNLYIPDANFKAYLVGNTSINTNSDTEIQKDEANAYSGLINCPSLSIADLTGIEGFSSIYRLSCNNNNLTSLDVSHNKSLDMLQCQSNSLTELDVSQNSLLDYLDCSNNFTLVKLNVTQNPILDFLRCGNTDLSELDVTNNTLLTTLESYASDLSVLDLTNNTLLNRLVCRNNNFTELNVSHLEFLESFYCQSNQITTLDLSKNINLDVFWGNDNLLTSLDIANGNNSNVTDGNFRADGNSGLSCIKVDDISYSTTNWTSIDGTTKFYINAEAGLDLAVCDGDLVTLSGSGATSYTWSNATNNVAFDPLNNGSIGDTVTYLMDATDGNGCTSEDSLYIVVNGYPTIAVSNDGSTITASQTGATYQWLDCLDNDSPIASENSINYTPNSTGSYSVEITLNGCADTSNCESITVVTGIDHDINNRAINVYPNPVTSILTIESQTPFISWQLLDAIGNVVLTGDSKQVDISTFSTGVYFLQIDNISKKVMIE